MEELYQVFISSSGVTTDSRNISENTLFFALRGEHFDGNCFAREAIFKGAICAVVDDPELKGEPGCFFVENSLLALAELASIHRKHLKCPILAITGTNGKTTTKELIVSVLSSAFKVASTKGNLNNHIGVPLTILSAPLNTEILIVEMGASRLGDIQYLCDITSPDYGLITNVGKAHLEGFGSPEIIFRTKTELFNYIKSKGRGIIVNADDESLVSTSAGKTIMTYGLKNGSVIGKVTAHVPCLAMEWIYENKIYNQTTNLFGAYNAYNVLAAVTTGLFFKIDPDKISEAIASYMPRNNRSQFVVTDRNNRIVLDAYNANPSSMNLALDEFLLMEGRPKCVILGAMKELGDYCENEHLSLLKRIDKHQFHSVLFVGNEYIRFKNQFPSFLYFENTKELADYLNAEKISDTYIIIKGSRANELEKVLIYL